MFFVKLFSIFFENKMYLHTRQRSTELFSHVRASHTFLSVTVTTQHPDDPSGLSDGTCTVVCVDAAFRCPVVHLRSWVLVVSRGKWGWLPAVHRARVTLRHRGGHFIIQEGPWDGGCHFLRHGLKLGGPREQREADAPEPLGTGGS